MNSSTIFHTFSILAIFVSMATAETDSQPATVSPPDDRLTITNTSGQVFIKVKVSEIRPDGLKVFHSKGVAIIPFRELPVEMQSQYGYDPQKEAEFHEEQAKQASIRTAQQLNQQIHDRIAATGQPSVLEIIQITGDGALAKGYWITEEEYEETEYRTVTKVTGLAGPGMVAPTRTTRVPIKKEKKTRVNKHPYSENIFIVGVPNHLVDGDAYRAVIYPCGRHQYTTVMGGQATVERYATTVAEARKLRGY